MTGGVRPIPCSILRGGTSRGVFFRGGDLPSERRAIEPILLDVFGSPDVRQINGLGGATSQTSKAAIIGPPSRPDADVDYTFAQVSVTAPLVDWGGNCGNISSAVGPFAIDAGLVSVREPETVVRIHNTNTGKIIVARVPVAGGRAIVEGDYAIPGVPGTGARIDLDFLDPTGSLADRALPTGRARDTLELSGGRRMEVSLVDAGNPVVFLRASDLGFDGTELPAAIEAATGATTILEEARSIAAVWLGLVSQPSLATARTPGLPKVGFVAPPSAYVTSTGSRVEADAADVAGRLMSMQTAHRSYMVTGAIATAAAALIPGTLVHEAARAAERRPGADVVRIAHPYGVMDTRVSVDAATSTRSSAEARNGHDGRDGDDGAQPHIGGIAVGRTARHILDGAVFVPRRFLEGVPEPAAAGPSVRAHP